jgi:intracellular septation protein
MTQPPASPPASPPVPQGLRLALEAGPLLVFFLANNVYGVMVGTAVLVAATVFALALSWRLERRLAVMPVVGCFFVLVFGGLTLIFDDATFIKLKPTIVNLLFAAVLLGGLAIGRTPIALVLGQAFQLDDAGWRKLSLRWGLFFIVLAALNEFVWRSFPTETWVNFKVFGILPLSIVFGMAQIPLIQKHRRDTP